jgi:rhodanese-related sulfurtransferase
MTTSDQQLPMEISPREVQLQLDAEDGLVLIDCRETEEHARAAITAAELIPMSEIQQRVAELDPYKHRHIVVHCHLGGRSLQVTHWLRAQGFAQTQSMAGGIEAWSQEIDPSVPRY